MNKQITEALDALSRDKAGIVPPFLSREELDELLQAWHKLYSTPGVETSNNRFIVDHRLYEVPEFARLATHPMVQEMVRRVIGDFQLAGYAVVATPHNAEVPTTEDTVRLHVDHVVYSDVPVSEASDTFVCVWVNFEELAMENGPFAIAVGSHHTNLDRDYYLKENPDAVYSPPDWRRWNWRPMFNIGPPGTTAVYSGKTWHAGTNNSSQEIRKGLNMNFVPRRPIDTHKRNTFDACALEDKRYRFLQGLLGQADYLIPRNPEMVYVGGTA